MGGMGGLCSLPSRFTPSSYDRCNLVLQRVDTGTPPLHYVTYFSDLYLQTMQYSLLLIYILKLAIHCGCYHGVKAKSRVFPLTGACNHSTLYGMRWVVASWRVGTPYSWLTGI